VPWALQADFIYWGVSVIELANIGTGRPNPSTEPNWDWMFLKRLQPDTTGAAFAAGENATYEYHIMSKRKCTELGQTLAFSWFNGAAGSKTIQVYARTMLTLP
jgi:hypothetical protein